MRYRTLILSLVLTAGCSDWDRGSIPKTVQSENKALGFEQVCQNILDKKIASESATSTLSVLMKKANTLDCPSTAKTLLALEELDLSEDVSELEVVKLDLDLLASLTALKSLTLSGHSVADVSALKDCKKLEYLDITSTGVNQSLAALKLDTLPESLRRLRVSVPSNNRSADQLQLINRFLKKRKDADTVVVAYVDQGDLYEAILPPPLDPKAKPLPTDDKTPTSKLGIFYNPKERSTRHTEPTRVFHRGYILDVSLAPASTKAEKSLAHLGADWAERGNKWDVSHTDASPYWVVTIRRDPPDEGITERKGAMSASEVQGAAPAADTNDAVPAEAGEGATP